MEELIGRSEGRAVHALCAGEVEVGFVHGNHFDDRRKS
jgi:hypothetical protein